MRILHTIGWGLVCLSAVVAGGFLASNLAAGRSETWSASADQRPAVMPLPGQPGRAGAEPRIEFVAPAKSLGRSLSQGEQPVLRLFPAAQHAGDGFAGSASKEAGQALVFANFNEDDRFSQAPKLAPPPNFASLPGLNSRAPLLSLPGLGTSNSDAQAPSGAALALLDARFDEGTHDNLGGLQAEGRGLSLSLFGHTNATPQVSSDAAQTSALAAAEHGADATATAQRKPAGLTSEPPKAELPIVETAASKTDVTTKPRPSAALIDPALQVASLNQDVGILPSFEAPSSKRASHAFPRLDISVALYHMDEPLPSAQRADRILVEKGARLLHLFDGQQLVKSYRIDLGFSPVGHKLAEGDGKTPEGDYRIDWRKKDSEFYRALHVSYPSQEDASIAKFSGRDPGGAIMIHGRPNGFGDNDPLAADWTAGCIAVKNAAIEEIWAAIEDGTAIRIRP
jgi:lipoprotein-anchoring transpeptidase ErfK/SrfK